MSPKTFIRKILTSSCVICTVISVFFYFIAAIVNKVESLFNESAVTFRQFLLILLFSFLVALANRLLSVSRLHVALRVLIHYATLLAAFLVVFIWAGKLKINGPAAVFLSIMIFTVLYVAFFLASYFTLRFLGALPSQKKPAKDNQEYRSRFH
ncbi:MAG: DUF3021 family protein [Clostridia bacterium]|nr:DUF3021 family protein [Clostridia bacterium]